MQTKRRNWRFKKSFLVFCAVAGALIILLLSLLIAREMRPPTSSVDPNGAAQGQMEQLTEDNQSKPEPSGEEDKPTAPLTTLSPTEPPTTLPPVTDPNEKVLYLTFDDGPSKNTTKILDILDQYGAKATFFVIHTYDGCEAQIKEIYERGHAIGLHSYSHQFSIYSSVDSYFKDLNQISDLVYNAIGVRSKLVRFPGGTSNTISRNYCDGIMTTLSQELPKRGYYYFDWDWDSTDASDNQVGADTIYQNSIKAAQSGDSHVILLMHDAPIKTTTVEALPRILQYYKDQGYRFDKLSETSYTYHHNPNN